MLHVVSKSRISWKPLPLRFAKEKCEVVQKAAEQEKDVYIGDMALSDVPSLSEIGVAVCGTVTSILVFVCPKNRKKRHLRVNSRYCFWEKKE